MGKSPTSCLKIIACGSDSAAENDDIDSAEARASGDKRKWSFRKRSGRHRVIGNNVSLETTTVTNKDIPQGINAEFQAPAKPNIPDEKPQLLQPVEKVTEAVYCKEHASKLERSSLSENDDSATNAGSKMSDAEVAVGNGSNATSAEAKTGSPAVVLEDISNSALTEPGIGNSLVVSKVDSTTSSESTLCDSVVAAENGGDTGAIIDQPVTIVIQTAIRGFLARRAFLQLKSAIKLQAAIRGHLVRRDAVETLHCIQAIIKVQALVRAHKAKSLDHKSKLNDAQFSTVKLHRNGFARQLLESTPKKKSVSIRCDPLRPNSTWGWLERWMPILTSKIDQPTLEPEDDFQVQQMTVTENAEFESNILSDSVTSNLNITEVVKSQENEENYIINDVSTTDSLLRDPLSREVKAEQSHPHRTAIIEDDVASLMMDALANKNSPVQAEPRSLVNKPASESEQPKRSTNRLAPELDGEGKKFVCGSKKASNPSFIAAQSKFQELSSAAKFGSLVCSSYEPNVVATVPFDPRSHVIGSECGTELSISSTLDSPDRSDFGNAEAERNTVLQEPSCDPNSGEAQDGEANGLSAYYVSDAPSVLIQQEEAHRINGISVDARVSPQEEQLPEMDASGLQTKFDLVMATDSSQMEQQYEPNGFNTQVEHDSGTEHQGYKSSPEASPKSHRTVPESQGTPSSQVSVKGKKNKTVKNGSRTKHGSLSAGKKSPSNPGLDSGARSSTENLLKDHKSGKRRNSFGSSKSDNVDQEPRDSSTRISLPSYMQATESARAKAHSPRSSPEVHDKEVTSKKRHSLLGANGKQGSPRIPSSTSPAAQGAKTNGSSERKWQR